MSSKSKSVSRSTSRSVSRSTSRSEPESAKDKSIFVLCMGIVVQLSILYYLYNLEGSECICKNNWRNDWRHKYIKTFAISMICVYTLILLFSSIQHNEFIVMIIGIFGFINFYALFTYVNDLNNNKCNCAVEKQYYLNTIIKTMLWFVVIIIILMLIGLLIVGNTVSKIKAKA